MSSEAPDWEDEQAEVDERRQQYNDMLSDLDSGECVVFQGHANRPDEVWFCGKHLCTLGARLDYDDALKMVNEEMNRQKFWPNIYSVNERGNVDLMDYKGNTIRGWV